MSFKENLNRICKEKDTSLTRVMLDLGFSSSKATAINTGQLPKEEVLIRLAKHLNCHVMDFFMDDDEPSNSVNSTSNSGDTSRTTTNNYYSYGNRSDCPTPSDVSLVFKMMDIMRELDDKSLSDLIKYGEYIANKRGE
jgi:hypothetical protein|nr:MAG TPA: SOS-response transcriptional repressor [Caudoviricetes sp.]